MSNNSGVYEYNRGSYDSYSRPQGSGGYQPQGQFPQQDPRFPVPIENDPNLRRSRFVDRNTGTRYDDYRKRRGEYKYNIYSLIDEPWNRCCEVGRCGTCPGNECIARRAPKLDWL